MLKNRVSQVLLILSLTTYFPTPSFSTEPKAPQQATQDFTSVAKKAIPAVVSIQIKNSQNNSSPQSFFFGDEQKRGDSDPFGDDFWQQFFGQNSRSGSSSRQTPVIGQASGFIVSPDGYILTNNHVVKSAGQIIVVMNDGKEMEAKIIGQDPSTDLAVIKVDGKELPHIKLGDSDDLEVGQWVVAIGNTLGLQASLTVGVVSAKGRNNLDLVRIEDFIQTDAAINKGNSGGPLLNLNGDVIGINTAIVSNTGTGGYMGIGFAIPSNMAQHVMEQLITDGSITRGYIGVTLQAIDQGLATAFNMEKPEGSLVAEIRRNSPAEIAGIKQGDIITKWNNNNVANITSFRNAVSLSKPGAELKLTVLRDGKKLELPVKVEAFPSQAELAGDLENKLGFDVQAITPELAQKLGILDTKGVIISKIKPGSAAAWAGLKKGALVVSVNRTPVSSTEEFYQLLDKTEKSKPVLLLIKQDDVMRFISLGSSAP